MSSSEDLCNLTFEVSNEDRLRILHQLEKEAMNVTNLSKTLNLSTQETSRHLFRLTEVSLTKKDIEGLYHLSRYGTLVLNQLQGLEFTSRHQEYFASHMHEQLPQELLSRMGELYDSIYIEDTMVALYKIERMIREAEEYVWSINFPIPMSVFPLLSEAFGREVKVRLMIPKEYTVHPLIKGAPREEDLQAIYKAWAEKLFEEKFMERMDVLLWMSEKEVAIVALPKPDGSFDLLGFASKDERAHKWCGDLFQYFWENEKLGYWIPPSPS